MDELQIIQLYETGFNSVLEYLVDQRLLTYGELHGLNGHQLYESRKGKTTCDARDI